MSDGTDLHDPATCRLCLPGLKRIVEAARAAVDGWDRYIEAQAGRGHSGPHDPEPVLDGDCGPCAGARYGTEVGMGEYVIPALRAALEGAPDDPK